MTDATTGNGHDVEGPSATTERGTFTTDTEVTTLSRVLKMLDKLDDDARGRVVRYIAERYEDALDAGSI